MRGSEVNDRVCISLIVAGVRIGPPSRWAIMNFAMSVALALIEPSGVMGSKMNGTTLTGFLSVL